MTKKVLFVTTAMLDSIQAGYKEM